MLKGGLRISHGAARDFLMKRTVFYLSLIAFIFYLIGRFFLLDAAAQSHDRLFALVALLVYPLAAGLCALIAWILGLIQTAKTGRWGWFAVIFFLPVMGSLIYGFFGPEDQPAMPMMQQAQWQDPYSPYGQWQSHPWQDARWQDDEERGRPW